MENNMLHGRSVLVGDNNLEKALRKFKKKVQNSGVLLELKAREFYTPPSMARKAARAAARRRWQKHQQNQKLPKTDY
jgi:ribosomal protein S21